MTSDIEALEDPDVAVRVRAVDALGQIGPAAVPALVEALGDPDMRVRVRAVAALGHIGSAAEPAVPAIVEALRDHQPRVRAAAAYALGRLGLAAEPVVPALVKALGDPNSGVRPAAAFALGSMGAAAEPAVPVLVRALGDPQPDVRGAILHALGAIGAAAEPAIPALVEALGDPEQRVQLRAASTLRELANALRDTGLTRAVEPLRQAQLALESHDDPEIRAHAPTVRRAVEYLELQRWASVRNDAADWIKAHPYIAALAGLVPVWLAVCLSIFWLRPAAIPWINDLLGPIDVKLPAWLGGAKIPLRHLLLVGALKHRSRVLDAWVARHLAKARKNFARKRTVEERSVHIPVPVYLGRDAVSELEGKALRRVFESGPGRLLIWAEGGAGKTSLACQIGWWAMADDPEQRPARHRMLPVLIERELDFEVGAGRDAFTETVRGDLETLIEADVEDSLLAALLKRRRVLVIVDHLSEMTEATRQRVRPDVPGFPVEALIVTSRLEERLGDVPVVPLRPLRVTGDYLFDFMGAYLRACGVRELFPDREFGEAGARIADLVGERAVTVLLVKLYLDRLVETKKTGGDIDKDMPASIPSLMLRYLNDLNRAVPDDARRDARAVHRDAKALAWTCLEDRFRPAPAQIDEVAAPALGAIDPEEVPARLDYLERRLRLIETVEPERDKVRFTLDPVAEYLAGLHLVDRHGMDATAWKVFLARAEEMHDPEALRGFLLAARDCCLAREGEVAVPEFVPGELARLAGVNVERLPRSGAHHSPRRAAQDARAG
jgi:HEAT repeat protein